MAQQPNPLLSPPFFVIPGISPSAPVSAQVQQIDQLNTLLLQEIDANFAKFHQMVTSKVLPEIKRFAIGGEPVREASQFWRSFFEAAAAVRVPIEGDSSHLAASPQHLPTYDDHTLTLRPEDSYLSRAQEDGSFMFQQPGVTSSTPVPGRMMGNMGGNSWEDSMESPFDRMDRKLRDDLGLDDREYAESSDMPTPSLPSGYSLPGMGHESYGDVSTGTVEPPDLPREGNPSNRPSSQAGGSSDHAAGDTPKPKRNPFQNNPANANTQWNGVTDLRHTPLNARFKGKGKERAVPRPKQSLANTIADLTMDDSNEEVKLAMSPPVTMNFTLPPRAQAVLNAGRTPVKSTPGQRVDTKGKEGEARMILDDLMEEMEMGPYEPSPRMPTPEGLGRYSVVPTELGSGRRLFTDQVGGQGQAGPSGTTSRRSLANTSYGSDIIDQPPQPTPVYGDEDTFDVDDDSFDSAYDGGGQTIHAQQPQGSHIMVGDDSDLSGDISGVSSVSSPTPGNASEAGMIFGGVGGAGRQDGRGFSLMKPDEMMTFHGGRLEDAAGMDVAFTPTNAVNKPNGRH